MGQEIGAAGFSEADRAEFRDRLREETKRLKGWFDGRAFLETEAPSLGLEAEAWLVDADLMPAPRNDEFLAAAADPFMVHELSQFNFELNTPPVDLAGEGVGALESHLEALWAKARAVGEGIGVAPLMIGMLPTVRDDMLQPEWMSRSARYEALNDEVMRQRYAGDTHIQIEGADALVLERHNVMIEAACTSIQVHLQTNQLDAKRLYNACVAVAAPLVAVAANAPFLYGRSLWADTRITTFEQAAACMSFRDMHGRDVGRVTLGAGYIRHSLLELFLENLDGYPVLLPALSDVDPDQLAHLRLQNGTVWRWVRPVIGLGEDGRPPHLRIEHRVMSAGPTIADVAANTALCCGLAAAYAAREIPIEEEIAFEDARTNFYAAARHGLDARVKWTDTEGGLQELMLERLIPEAREGLARLGVAPDLIRRTIDETIHPRVLSGRTGAAWQRSFVDLHGPDFQALTERYLDQQKLGRPVHEWTA